MSVTLVQFLGMTPGATVKAKRGSALSQPVTVYKDGVPMSLVGCTGIVYLLKKAPADNDADAVIAFTTSLVATVQLVVTNEALGQITLNAGPAKMLLPRSRYFGAIQMTHPTHGLIEFSSDADPDVWELWGHNVLAAA
jgi:hypothetical protein